MFLQGNPVRHAEVLDHLQQQPLSLTRHHQPQELHSDQLLEWHVENYKQYQNLLLLIQHHYHN